MIKLEELTRGLVINSLRSNVCPACAGPKTPSQSLCYADYRRLPADVKTALYNQVGDGYEEALHRALAYLRATTFHAPGLGGRCARTACGKLGAVYRHRDTGRLYCIACARRINEENGAALVEIPAEGGASTART